MILNDYKKYLILLNWVTLSKEESISNYCSINYIPLNMLNLEFHHRIVIHYVLNLIFSIKNMNLDFQFSEFDFYLIVILLISSLIENNMQWKRFYYIVNKFSPD